MSAESTFNFGEALHQEQVADEEVLIFRSEKKTLFDYAFQTAVAAECNTRRET